MPHEAKPMPLIIPPDSGKSGQSVRGATLVIEDWTTGEATQYVAPLHVHRADDEAWHVVSGSLRFRFEDRDVVVTEGSTVLVPAGTPHTFGNAGPGPSRFLIILSSRLQQLIAELHAADPSEHAAIYSRHESALLG